MASRYLLLNLSQDTSWANRLLGRSAVPAIWTAWLLTVAGLFIWRPELPAWVLMAVLMGVCWYTAKALVLAAAGVTAIREMGPQRVIGFVLAWPGLDLHPFLVENTARPPRPDQQSIAVARRWTVWGVINLAAGAGVLAVAGAWASSGSPVLLATLFLCGLSLAIHYGLFQLIAGAWKARGFSVQKQWDNSLAAANLREFWNRRWNLAFHDFAREQIYGPVRSRLGVATATVMTFAFSGLIHELAISGTARGGYGLPTIYFLLQAAGLWVDRRFLRSWSTWLRRTWAAIVVIAPVGLLFHWPFIERVLLPMFTALRELI